MEGIVGFILLVIGWLIFRWILSAGFRTAGAAAKAAIGKGTFSENMNLAFKGMGSLEARFVPARFGENGDGPPYKALQVKGLFPIRSQKNIRFVTSVFDETDGEFKPVLGVIDTFQEPHSVAYQTYSDIGAVSADQGFVQWTTIGAVVPELLSPPRGGRRKFVAILIMVDLDNMPAIHLGTHDKDHPGLLWVTSLKFEHTVNEKGYEEAAEHQDQARSLSIQIGMAVAMADGSLDDTEGNVLKDWIVRAISSFADEKRERLKEIYNNAMKEAFEKAIKGFLTLSDLTSALNKIAERSVRYETIELCFDVMAADGVADPEELKIIRKISEALELDLDEIEKMRDQKIIGLSANVSSQASLEDLLGIDTDWEADKIKKHLRMEFQKWNNRINTLEEGEERANAQRMLDLIAKARKKYA